MERCGTWAVALLLAVAPSVGAAQDPRAALRLAPAKLYPEMIRMVERHDWAKLDQAVNLLDPLIGTLRSNPTGLTLRQRLAARDPQITLAAVSDLAILGVEQLVRQARGESDGALRREMIRSAFTEFLAIAVVLEASHFRLRQEIEQAFRACYGAAGTATAFTTESSTLLGKLALILSAESGR